MSEPVDFYALGHTSILKLRPYQRFATPAVRLELYALIGHVALYWGAFEQKMDSILSAFAAADNDPDDKGWQKRPFIKRKKMLKDKIAARFPGPIADEVSSILSAGATYHWQRNLVVHGHTFANFVNGVGTAFARGTHNGKYLAMPLEAPSLERMYGELGFLTGRLENLTSDAPDGCNLALPDRLKLRAFVQTNLPPAPTPQIVAPQHPA